MLKNNININRESAPSCDPAWPSSPSWLAPASRRGGGGGGGDVIYPDPSLSDMQASTTISLPSCLYCTLSHFLRANFKPRLGACVNHLPSVLSFRIL
jgi:hypothetical protein